MSHYGGLTSYRGYHQLKILFIANITGMNSAVRKGSSSCSTNITGMNSAVRKGSSSCSTKGRE